MKLSPKTKIIKTFAGAVFVTAVLFAPFAASAELVVTPNPSAPAENRFIVGPAKLEATIAPGESTVVFVDLENRTGRTEAYSFSFEDFVASDKPGEVVTLVPGADATRDTSLMSDLLVSQNTVTLAQGDRVRVPVSIAIPVGTTPGGKFGALVVSAHADASTQTSGASATIVGRTAVLIFVTVSGDVHHDASLKSFKIGGAHIVFGTPLDMQIAFANNGSVNENPYGGITVHNMFGTVISKTAIDPWFVLPGAVRTRDVSVSTTHLFGVYHATLEENRGYDDTVDTASVTFVALAPGTLFSAIIALIVIGFLLRKKI